MKQFALMRVWWPIVVRNPISVPPPIDESSPMTTPPSTRA